MTSAADTAAVPRDRTLDQLSEQLPRFLRLISAAKVHLSTDPRDRAALVLLTPLARLGPLRQGALAEHVRADPSTVSRHVAALVDEGLVRRVADESDGRATQLVVTDAGTSALEQLGRDRAAVVRRITAGWAPDDLATFSALLGRFLDDLAAALPGDAITPAPGDLR
ncbi:MarR family transcriptional regulator [Blastococcus sp. TML/M2B]|uniref:MarR family winged helix-turn-helix transcriptional regulator n=1 Tax=unclassified Blastococcus TaxID=2619396 RepID=UPI00190A5906|nr:MULTISPECIES: MarR family transcriptional regulator [unclassified Blastococcus]MBN1094144.1 MarR family transcriptional regulator [Blastococcus sp. TML/M2B]MBN1095736.1 MarR family transcriptional regulator [Blastococcus sp. TML/C7B]